MPIYIKRGLGAESTVNPHNTKLVSAVEFGVGAFGSVYWAGTGSVEGWGDSYWVVCCHVGALGAGYLVWGVL